VRGCCAVNRIAVKGVRKPCSRSAGPIGLMSREAHVTERGEACLICMLLTILMIVLLEGIALGQRSEQARGIFTLEPGHLEMSLVYTVYKIYMVYKLPKSPGAWDCLDDMEAAQSCWPSSSLSQGFTAVVSVTMSLPNVYQSTATILVERHTFRSVCPIQITAY